MRHLWAVAFLCAVGCTPQSISRPAPTDAFYFPSGLVYVNSPSSPQGMLYVASANYDKRYDSGSIIAVPLSFVAGGAGLPAFGAGSPFPPQIDDLGVGISQVVIQSFAGEMDSYSLPDGTDRLFIPTRAEGDLLEIVDARNGSLNCLNGGTNCIDPTLSLTSFPSVVSSKPRAPEPVGVGVSNDGQVYVTHLKPADSPPKTNQSQETYAVNVEATNPVIDASRFISLGFAVLSLGPSTSSVAVGTRYAYLSSRYFGASGAMIWLVHRVARALCGAFLSPCPRVTLESSYLTLEARGVALNPEETRLYVAGRNPDSLVVVELTNVNTDNPGLRVVRAVPLPEGPNEVRVISRRNVLGGGVVLGDLVVVTSSTAGAVSIYDDGVGRLVAQIPNVGIQPFGLAVRVVECAAGMIRSDCRGQRETRARIFVSNFGDGRIAVIDLEDLARPQTARLAAYLGKQQTCLVQNQDASCVGARP